MFSGRESQIILEIERLERSLDNLVLAHDDRVIIMRAIEDLEGDLRMCLQDAINDVRNVPQVP
jgi:hypothetical protein